ncbi:P-loop containing nucleoside triphosphate hydrolase protein [Annulohypoxylon maeteangense]|uniref:P-loop containing nucleoside triphosphate hydrolase protein n=1 Tax=Annulohypoxylon maeteangense TaxID=1927788 RepID=UPI0020080DB1|nr:P-loop containing nucleoside triphosphate hydrolase protein [Annulohypoxylon maeteangense]KAI0880006.1 P-loop containing nucleoside triphosphate hydrolase protein [Annulohypoxylon maeteangense]
MGISTSGKAFSRDRLRVEITGPDRPHLTIIDMPGLIHSETKLQSAADVKLVRKVVKGYMKQARSVILAVVSAKNDFANQVVLNFAREVDKRGSRTMGVITKPDTLVQGSGSEALYVSLARNNQVNFDLGWHVLKNLDSETQKGSSLLGHRNAEEALFFSRGVWNELPSSMLGINELRKKLSNVLLRQIAFELPSLIREINLKLDDSREDLEKLGEPRRTLDEQRLRLLQISEEFQSLVERSISGTYNSAFFEDAETDQGYQERIRAVIQALNKEFAEGLVKRGHRREIGSGKQESPNDPELVTRDKFLDHVENIMQRTRGRELPGIFSSMIVADLFQQQSLPWERIAQGHVKKAWEAVGEFLELVATYVADASISDALIDKIIQPALDKLLVNAKNKTSKLLDSHRRVHPITYNHEYAETIHGHCCRSKDEISKIVKNFFGLASIGGNQYLNNSYYNFNTLVENLAKHSGSGIERSAACEALDRMLAYYQIALKRFIDSIATEVIEQKIIMPLSDILSPVAVFKMSPDLVELIAGESQESRTKREELTKKTDVLQRGLKTCKRFVDSKLKGEWPPLEGIKTAVDLEQDDEIIAITDGYETSDE